MTANDVGDWLSSALEPHANPSKAEAMQAYLKTEMPMYGINKPLLRQVFRQLHQVWTPASAAEWQAVVQHLWSLPHREEKFAAIEVLAKHKRFHTPDSVPLMEALIREGAWWDLVDEVVCRAVSPMFLKQRGALQPTIERWGDDDDVWVRRAALISQLKHRDHTDLELLFRLCRRRAPETVFWIRKAIGWALREASKHHPSEVRAFMETHGHELSGLSRREASKYL